MEINSVNILYLLEYIRIAKFVVDKCKKRAKTVEFY